jgi:protein required for attachment to host cells
MTTRCNWIVIANAARARIIEVGAVDGACRHVADLVHPESRLTGTEQAALHGGDRPGRVVGIGHGAGNASYQPHTDPRRREHDRFAREVAAAVDEGTAKGRLAGLILVASDPFLGRLKSSLGEQSLKLLLRTVVSDFTTLPDAEVLRRLSSATEQP